MVRDSFKNFEYYKKELERCDSFIENLKEKAVEAKDMSRFYTIINEYIKNKILILYVLLEEKVEIQKSVEEYIDNLEKRCRLGKTNLTYNEIVFALSWAYLLDLDVSNVWFINENMIEEKYIDASLDLIRNKIFRNEDSTNKTFYFKDKGYFGDCEKSEDGLMNVLRASKEEQADEFLKLLKNVKQKHYSRLIKYYETIDENRYTYTGSFDCRLSAIAKILKIDKVILKESKFIMVDLI